MHFRCADCLNVLGFISCLRVCIVRVVSLRLGGFVGTGYVLVWWTFDLWMFYWIWFLACLLVCTICWLVKCDCLC